MSLGNYLRHYWCFCVFQEKTYDPAAFVENHKRYRAFFGAFHVKDVAVGLALFKTIALIFVLVPRVVDGSSPLTLVFGISAFFGVCLSNIMLISGIRAKRYSYLIPYFTVCVLFIFVLILHLFVDFLETANNKDSLHAHSILHNGGLLLMTFFEIYMLNIVWRTFVYICDVNMHFDLLPRKRSVVDRRKEHVRQLVVHIQDDDDDEDDA